jgi:hypothetical protein
MSGSCDGRRWVVGIAILAANGCGSVTQITPDAAIDTPIDVMPDTPPGVTYDIAYVNEITQTPSNLLTFSFLVVVNKGMTALNTLDVQVVSFIDDNPGIDWEFMRETGATKVLGPGLAAGTLSPLSRMRIVDSGLVTEPIDDPFLNFVMIFRQAPPAGITINTQAVLRIDGKEAVLPFVIHVIASGNSVFHGAKRVSSQP